MEQLINNPLILLPIVAWSLFWKGLALWRAAKDNQQYWFIAILMVNTLGVLEIVYLFRFAKKKTLWEKLRNNIFPRLKSRVFHP